LNFWPTIRSDCDGSKELDEIGRIDAARQDAEKDPVFAGEPMRNDRVEAAGEQALHRLGPNRRRLRVELERLEVAAFGDVEARRRQRPRPVDDVALGIVQRDVAEIGQHSGLGPEDLVGFRTRHHLTECLRRGDAGNA
jgi:hypothetical protein